MQTDAKMSWENAVCWLRSQPDKEELVRACYYDDPITDAADRFRNSTEWRAVQRLLTCKRGKALDIGSGRGIASYALAKDDWQVTALEPDPSNEVGSGAIKRLCSESQTDIEVVSDWGEALPFADGSFDLVYCRAVLHHARDLRSLCAEAARVLRRGGTFLATREHVISKSEDLQEFLQSHPLHHLYGGEHAYLLQEYVDAIRSAGFVSLRVFNPWSSDINLFPDTFEALKARSTKKLSLPSFFKLPIFVFGIAGQFSRRPGRLYTFLARKN